MIGRRKGRARTALAAALLALAALVGGCGGTSSDSTGARPATHAAPSSGTLPVVAAENFWGDLAARIGGGHVTVTSLLSDPQADPHLFEPGGRNGLSVSQARVVVVNGAGYDDWMDKLLAASPARDRQVVKIADVLQVTGSDANPHLWYDTLRLPQVVTAIGDTMAMVDPVHAGDYRAGVAATLSWLAPLRQAVTQLRADAAGAPVAYTERVAGLQLAAAGLSVLSPPGFARAIEDGTDPSAADVAAMRALLTGHKVRALLYNQQAASPLTTGLQQLAAGAGVPVVPVTETEPPGEDFVSWQLRQVTALRTALLTGSSR